MRKWLARRRLNALDALVTGEQRDWRMGLSTHGYHLVYRVRGGFGYRWLPVVAQETIVKVWNPIACLVWGHDLLDEKALGIGTNVVCTSCCKEWPV